MEWYTLIELFTIVVGTQMVFGRHRNFDAFAILHAEFPQYILEVFLLRYEYAIVLLTYLKT